MIRRSLLLLALLPLGCGGRVASEPGTDDAAPSIDSAVRDSSAPPLDVWEDPIDTSLVEDSRPPIDTAPPTAEPGDLASTINVVALALTADDVIWSDGPGSGSVFRVKKTGGPTTKVLKSPVGPVNALAVDGSTLFLTYGITGAFMVGRIPLAGGTVTQLAIDEKYPSSIAVRDGRVYWLNSSSGGGGSLVSTNLDGSDRRVIVSGLSFANDLVLTATDAYFRDGSDTAERLVRCTLATGATTTLTTGYQLHAIGLLADAVFTVKLVTSAENRLVRLLGGVETVLATDPGSVLYPGRLVADATTLYFQFPSTGIVKMPISGGAITPFASAPMRTVTAMAADETALYWGEQRPEVGTTYVVSHPK